MADAMDKLAEWMGASSGEELRILRDNLNLYGLLLDRLLRAIDTHRDTLDAAALHGPKRDRDCVDNDLYNLARQIRADLATPLPPNPEESKP